MTKFDSLEENIRNNPKNVSFSDLEKLLKRYGFEKKKSSGGSHFLFRYQSIRLNIVFPHGKKGRKNVNQFYVNEALAAIDKIKNREGKEYE